MEKTSWTSSIKNRNNASLLSFLFHHKTIYLFVGVYKGWVGYGGITSPLLAVQGAKLHFNNIINKHQFFTLSGASR